jgi:hypothetical protein
MLYSVLYTDSYVTQKNFVTLFGFNLYVMRHPMMAI